MIAFTAVLCIIAAPEAEHYVQIEARGDATCALARSGRVTCWGGADESQPRLLPATILDLSDAAHLMGVNCAVRRDGESVCWDWPSLNPRARPGPFPTTPTRIVNGLSCELAAGGALTCQGNFGPDGDPLESKPPTTVEVEGGAAGLAAGEHGFCVWTTQGRAHCFGGRGHAQNGPLRMHEVELQTPARQVVVGDAHACARLADGHVACWGHVGDLGLLGDGVYLETPRTITAPVAVATIDDARWITAGRAHTCVARASGEVACWGSNHAGQLGLPLRPRTPTEIPLPRVAVRLVTSKALLANGEVWSWRVHGRVPPVPQREPWSPKDAVHLDVRGPQACVVRRGGRVSCVGRSREAAYAYGDGATLVPMSGLNDTVEVALGDFHGCARRRRGPVRCWGVAWNGAAGKIDPRHPLRPVDLPGSEGAIALAAAGEVTVAAMRDGGVRCWGACRHFGALDDHAIFFEVPGIDDAVDLASGYGNTCVVHRTGASSCFGSNEHGALGLGSDPLLRSGVLTDVERVREVSVGHQGGCVVDDSGRAACWGRNAAGELGDGKTERRDRPAPVRGVSDVEEITIGDAFTCARRRSGTVACWGGERFSSEALPVRPGPPSVRPP